MPACPPAPSPVEAPCARGHAVWGHVRELGADPLGLYEQVQREHGDVARVRLLGGLFHVFVLASPDAIERVLSANHANYVKPPMFLSAVEPVFTGGVFSAEGAAWKRKRRLLGPAFHPDRLQAMAPTIVAAAEDQLAAWDAADLSQPVDLLEALNDLTLGVAARIFFGVDLDDDGPAFGQALRVAFDCLGARLANGFSPPLWIPTPGNRRLRRARDTLRAIVRRLIAARAAAQPTAEAHDMLGRLLAARDDDGQGLAEHELIGEVITLLIAGHDTTAAALAWTLDLLGRHPAVRDAVHDEVDGVLGGRSPTAADLPRLPLVRMAFDEALRLYPPAWGQPRQAVADDVVDGFRLPAGAMAVTSQWLVHRHPDHWDDPLRFDPERFSPARAAGRHRFAYVPFGGGPRLCIGKQLALLEAPLLLAALLDRYRFEPLDPAPRPDPTFTLRPRDGLRARLVRRRG